MAKNYVFLSVYYQRYILNHTLTIPPFLFFAIGTERFANICLMNYTKIKTLGRLRNEWLAFYAELVVFLSYIDCLKEYNNGLDSERNICMQSGYTIF